MWFFTQTIFRNRKSRATTKFLMHESAILGTCLDNECGFHCWQHVTLAKE